MEQIDLNFTLPVAPEPSASATPEESKLDLAFARYHEKNPSVDRKLVVLAAKLCARGHRRLGIGMLFEVLRWEHRMATVGGDGFKLNNNYRSRYARMIMRTEPALDGMFELRVLDDEREQGG